MREADVAWLILALLIVAYEIFAPPGELLSEGWDRYLQSYPFLARLLPLVVTLHVINALPDRLDPFHQGSGLLRRLGEIIDRSKGSA